MKKSKSSLLRVKIHWKFILTGFLACVLLQACQTGPGGVADKVLADFGLKEHPEGYTSGTDRVYEQLQVVGTTELKRMNAAGRHGEIKFEGEGRRGNYYKETRVYESFRPVDVNTTSDSVNKDRGFSGTIEYRYRIFESARKPTQTEAAAQSADLETTVEGVEVYRYNFSTGGVWDGASGEKTKR